MSRTSHHRNKNQHAGHDYGARYRCNKSYGNSYGVDGRNLADKERRQDDKRLSLEGVNQVDDMHLPDVCDQSHTGNCLHDKGDCPDCDYHRYVDMAEAKGLSWDDPQFIESWDWLEYWRARHEKEDFI